MIGSTREATIPIIDTKGQKSGAIHIKLTPATNHNAIPPPLLKIQKDQLPDPSIDSLQLLEGEEYIYDVELDPSKYSEIVTDKPEIFSPDSKFGNHGRLRPGLYVGLLTVSVNCGGSYIGRASLEVRSKKLDYLKHYRWMLRDIAESLSEVIMDRFAPSEQRFKIDDSQNASTLYQRFAFLKSLLEGEDFDAAIQEIVRRPHHILMEKDEYRRPGQGVPINSRVASQLVKPGPRTLFSNDAFEYALSSLPERIIVTRRDESLDTPENRFIKFALTSWRSLVNDIGRVLEKKVRVPREDRGMAEVRAMENRLEAILSEEVFREVGQLTQFPAGSQVLQKREGYRELSRIYIQLEAAAMLAWEGGEDVYAAGQRDVATLYEYWVYFQLIKIISEFCDEDIELSDLLEADEYGIQIRLKRGENRVLTCKINSHGRCLRLELWFNRTFGSKSLVYNSWSRPMRPDCSLRISPDESCEAKFDDVWLHFDAKYRVEAVEFLFGKRPVNESDEQDELSADEDAEIQGRPKRQDLLKMHAYRDAIRKSAGAYVIYPGEKDERLFEYREILPGLGAFALRPVEGGEANGKQAIAHFIEEVITHVSSQMTQHERWRYWTKEVYSDDYVTDSTGYALSALKRPPADTMVLLGYVKSKEHLDWIHTNKLYNLRADDRRGSVKLNSRMLSADILILYSGGKQDIEIWLLSGDVTLKSSEEMCLLGYPEPRGKYYHCLHLYEAMLNFDLLDSTRDKLRSYIMTLIPKGRMKETVLTSWFNIVRATCRHQIN